MQCGCPTCGILMARTEQGVKSTCVCPECGYKCSACMGTRESLLAPDQVRRYATELLEADKHAQEGNA